MSVRRLTDADAAPLRALRLRALREEPDPFLTTFEEEQARPLEDLIARLRQQIPRAMKDGDRYIDEELMMRPL
ncbi:hypothetical protein [Sorangium sp. So ce1024]|uniref:hypothetical protein n=1 Tax=unclassified Sorangium TaxID=2621164 RepID=UPI003F124EB6